MILVPMLLASVGAFSLYRFEGDVSKQVNSLIMVLVGLLLAGAANIMVSAIAADLGTHPILMNNAKAVSTVSGIIDGTGSAGAAAGQVLVAWVSRNFGWDAVFYMLMIMTFCSAVCLSRLFMKETVAFVSQRKTGYRRIDVKV